jgi:hypothetical protein
MMSGNLESRQLYKHYPSNLRMWWSSRTRLGVLEKRENGFPWRGSNHDISFLQSMRSELSGMSIDWSLDANYDKYHGGESVSINRQLKKRKKSPARWKLDQQFDVHNTRHEESAVLSYQIIVDRNYPNKSNKQAACYYIHILKMNGAEGILSILRYGDQLSFSTLSELEEDCHLTLIHHHIFIPQDSNWLLVLTEREFPDDSDGKLQK